MRMNDSEAYNPSGYPEGGPEWCIHHEDYVDDHNSFNCPLTFEEIPEPDTDILLIPEEFTFEENPIYFQIVKEHTWKYTVPSLEEEKLYWRKYYEKREAEYYTSLLLEPKPYKSWWRRFMDWLSR